MNFVLSAQQASEADLEKARILMSRAKWKTAQGRDYVTADVSEHYPDMKRAFFVRLPPWTMMHRHVDAGDCRTAHLVVETNPLAFNWWSNSIGDFRVHLLQGWRYEVDRTVEHWAENGGFPERTHLLMEF